MTLPAESTSKRADESVQGVSELAGKYLTFSLANEEYGVGILKVREIIGVMEITAVPHTPPHIKGVINLRGRVIPVMDLRLKFGMPAKGYDERTCVIVVEVQGRSSAVQVGMVVDSVSEVVNIAGSEIEPPPSMGASTESDNILGMAKVKGEVKILLDVDRVVGEGLLRQFEEM
ncbi:chemotaxis protein CheW [Desulfurivibrio dismutans]|uniref:chemotaxis protein CheW n=1 Tax=Desulfurivibrio dismutans TaxID=1398908 RepID=UPI0023DAE531|nr:chemotaxis protein CheW [Desulfurivibrio alkaliphilus]MDF1615174.1 chemotaxis protein CheW [Desulfurivibrio alkaliphilus]